MKRRISLFISVLMTLVLAACAGAAEVKINASDGAAGDWFGCSVSTSDDYSIVGAVYDDDRGISSGSAYIFKRNGTTWSQQAKITASDGATGDGFANSVAISGEYAIASAGGDDDRGSDSGSAYIFKRNGTTWSQQAKLTASDGTTYDYFGNSVSISGDYVVVGANGDDDNGDNSGSAYIFKRDGALWSEQAKITASDGAAGGTFGRSVSISGDYVLVSAYAYAYGGYGAGSTYIYKRDGTAWSQQTKLTASGGATYDCFGESISISGDYAIVSDDGDDHGSHGTGSAYIFKRDGASWNQQAKINASDSAEGDTFGEAVSISSDYAIVGACYEYSGYGAGSAYIYKCDGTTWSQQTKLTASDGVAYDLFGYSVSISGDHVLVGAIGDWGNGSYVGSAYIYDILTSEPPITGDLNGDDRLTPADAVIALKMAAGCCEPTTTADVSDDGVVNSLDALMILRAAAGLIAL